MSAAIETIATFAAFMLATTTLACDTPQGATAGDASIADSDSTDPVCAAYCDHAATACAINFEACRAACHSFLSGKCGPEWRVVYHCGTSTTLTCNASGAHPYACVAELSSAGDCLFPPDAARGQ